MDNPKQTISSKKRQSLQTSKKSQAKGFCIPNCDLKMKAPCFERILFHRFLPKFPRFLAYKDFFAPPEEISLDVNQLSLVLGPV